MSSYRVLRAQSNGGDKVVGTIKVDQGSIPKGKVKTLDEYVSALKAGEKNTSAEQGNNVITASTIASVDGITQITIDNLNSVDIENYNYYKIEEAYLTKAKLIKPENIGWYLKNESYNTILQVAKPAPAAPDAPAADPAAPAADPAPAGDADPAATGGRRSRRSKNQRKSRRSRKQRNQRKSRKQRRSRR